MRVIAEDLVPVMAALVDAADRGFPCPANEEIVKMMGAVSKSAGYNALARLEAIDMISVERFRTHRVVTITATGKQTYRKPEDAPRAKRHYVNRDDHWLAARVVDRDPCFRCGVRGDVGCEHKPAGQELTIAEVMR